jgi:hypothetical protein
MEAAQAAYPDAFPGIGEQLLGAPVELLKGFGRGFVDPVSGLLSTGYTGLRAAGVEMDPFAETAVGKGLAGIQESLAPGYGTISEFTGAVGGLGSFIVPGALLAKGLGRATSLGGMATGLGAEEARSRVEEARAEGIEVTPGQEFTAQLGGTAIGLTELAPIERLTGPLQAVLRGVKKSDAEMIAPGLFNSAKRMVETGGIEGLQEGMANVAQDLLAKGIYNPNLSIGDSALGDAAMGASVGAFAQGAIELVTRGRRKSLYESLKTEEEQKTRDAEIEKSRLAKETARKQTLTNFGVEGQPLLLAAPQGQITPSRQEKSSLDQYGVEDKDLFEPYGTFTRDELDKDVVKELDKRRDEAGRPKTETFTLQDIADTGVYRGELNRLIAQRSGYTGETKFKPSEVVGLAEQKNIDTSTQGFSDFVGRVTGKKPLPEKTGLGALQGLNDVEIFAVREAINKLPTYEQRKILPTGKAAKIFDDKQATRTLTNIKKTLGQDLGEKGLGETSVLKEIGDFSGLKDVNDQQSLLEKYIADGELERVSTPAVAVLNANGKQVSVVEGSTQTERVQAQKKAQEIGGTIKDTSINQIRTPDPVNRLIGGFDIRQGTFEDTLTDGYDITTETGEVIGKAKTLTQAESQANRATQLREQRQLQLLDAKQKIQENIAKNEQAMADLEALGKKDSEDFKKIQNSMAAQERNLAKVEQNLIEFGKKVAFKSRHKQQKRTGFTLFEGNKPVGTYNSRQEALEASVVSQPTDRLEAMLEAFPTLSASAKPGMDRADIKKLQQVAASELASRKGEIPSGVGITVEGDITAAEERLALQGIFSPRIKERVNELDKKLRAALDKLGLKDVRLNIVGAIKGDLGVADGAYAARLIKIAFDAENPMRVLRHEGIHALKELGAFTPDQFRVLENKAKSEWMAKYNIAERYQGLDPASMLEEAISDAFSDFSQTKPPAGLIGNVFSRIKSFFTALDNGFKGLGFQTANDVFGRVERGELLPGMGERAAEVQGLQAQRVVAETPERYKLREEGPRILKNGQIVGSPPNARTVPQRTALVRGMSDLLRSPFTLLDESKNWYEDSGAAIREITRGDPELTERVVRLMALYSQANGVGGNTTATIKSIYQLATGQSTAFAGRFPNTTAERIPAILAAPTMDDSIPGVDDKLMNFYRNLYDATYQTNTFDQASTIDRWMMRLFGYPHSEDQDVGGATGLSKTQYDYAKDIVRRIGDAHARRTGEQLLPRQIQAALWTYVKNKTEYDSLSPEKQATFEPSIIDFSDYITRATANITWETRPSTSVDFLPGIHKAPRNQQESFNRAVRSIFEDKNGNDLIFQLLEGEQLYSSQFSIGAYENQIAPNIVTRLVLRKDDKGYLTDAANKYASIVGYVTKQDAVPWYRADPTASGKLASVGYRVTASIENVDADFEQRLFDHLNEVMPGIGFTRVNNSFDFVNFRGEDGKPFFLPDKKYKSDLQNALESFPEDIKFNVEPFRAESAYIFNDWKENTNGEGYLSAFSPGELANIRDTLDGWRSNYDRIGGDYAKEFGWDKPKYSLRGTNTPQFREWFGQSKIVDAEGRPRVMYHGTARDITEFKPKQAGAIFVTDDPRFAEDFSYMSEVWMIDHATQFLSEQEIKKAVAAGVAKMSKGVPKQDQVRMLTELLRFPVESIVRDPDAYQIREEIAKRLPSKPNILPVYVRAENPFDFDNQNHLEAIRSMPGVPVHYQRIRRGEWSAIEEPDVQEAIQKAGFDSFYITEGGRKNLAVYDPNQLKSVTGNIGTYGQREPTEAEAAQFGMTKEEASAAQKRGDLRYSLRSKTPPPQNIQKFFDQAERLETTSDISDLRDAWIGGVSDSGLNEAAYYINDVPGGKDYTKNVQKLAKQMLGNRIKGFRLMSTEELENIRAGDLSYYAAFTLNPNTALSFANFVQNRKIAPKNLVVVEADINPGDIHMIGKDAESEVVVDMFKLGDQKVQEFAQPVRFSLRQQAGQTLGQSYLDTVQRTTTPRVEKGFKDRISEAMSATPFAKFRQMFINKYERIEYFSKQLAKQFGDAVLLADQSAIAAALMSDRAAGVAAESFKSGIPVYAKGYTYVDNMGGKVKGLMEILMPLAQKQDPFVYQMYQDYAARRRGVRLDSEGKITPFTRQELSEIPKIEKAFPEFKQVFDDYQRYNEGLVRYMRDTGVIDAKAAQEWMRYGDYVPFYRQLEGESTVGPSIFSAISGVKAPKKLKGGDAPLGEFIETVVRNSRAAIEAGMRNVAANRVVTNFQRLNSPSTGGRLVEKTSEQNKNRPDVVTVRENGKDAYYKVADPLLVQSLQALNIPQIPGLDILAKPAEFLREMVTRDPAFIGASVLRESLSAWITTGQKLTPVASGVNQFIKILSNASPTVQALRRAGIGSGYEFKGDVQSTAGEFGRQLKEKAGEMTAAQKAVMPLRAMWDGLDKASTAADLSTRAAVFERVMQETGNEAEAIYQAMEVINFSRKGSSPIIQIFAAIIPFLNARIQGLDLLYRAGFGELASATKVAQQKAFMLRSLALLGTTAMYYALVQDEEEWQRADQETRDNYWIIGNMKFPIPFELGVMFKVIPERIMAYTMGEDTGEQVRASIARQILGTLSFNPIPQAVLPLIEASSNYSFFLQRDIVGMGKKDLAPEFQISEGTSQIAIQLGQALGISPMKIDYVIRGYTGAMGTYAISTMDSIIRSEDDATKATWRLDQIPVLKRFMISDLGAGTVNEYYDLREKLDEVVRTSNQLERTGNIEALQEYLKDNGQVLGMKDYVRSLDKDMKSLRESRMAINMSRMESDQKREALDSLRRAEISLTERIGLLRSNLGV